MNRQLVTSLGLTASALIAATPALAVPAIDPASDFLATYTGPRGLDLDVLSTEAFVNTTNNTLSVTATLGGAVGTTTGGFYVFGFNRGAGTERFVGGTPSVGAGVAFDLVLILRPDGTGQVNDIVGATSTPLAAGSVLISGNTISSAALPLSLFPSRGLLSTGYSFNLWPRVSTVVGNAAISDFAPDASNAGVTVVPSPAAGMLLLSGGALGALRRRR